MTTGDGEKKFCMACCKWVPEDQMVVTLKNKFKKKFKMKFKMKLKLS